MSGGWAVDEPELDTWRQAQLVLVRHGESLWNAERRVQGQNGTGLSTLGQAQALAVAEYLTATHPDPVAVFSSDLERVLQTAEPYLSRTGYPVELDKRLREVDTGDWTGLHMSDVTQRFPDQIAAIRSGTDLPRGGGETFTTMRARVGAALHDIARVTVQGVPLRATATVLAFTHGGPIRVAVAEMLGLPPNGHRMVESPANCSVTVLKLLVHPDGHVITAKLGGYNDAHVARTATGQTSHDTVEEATT